MVRTWRTEWEGFHLRRPRVYADRVRLLVYVGRPSDSSASLDYANRWRGQHRKSAYHDDQKSCSTRLEISNPGRRYGCTNIADIVTPSAKELGITFRPGIRIAYVTTIRNQHSETIDRALILWNSVPGPKFRRGACVLVHRLSYPLGRTRIFVRPAIGTGREAPIRNRHIDPVGTSSASLDYANRWRGQHTESAYHGDRKSCSTRLEISTPAKELGITFRQGIGITYVTTDRKRHSETVDRALVSWNSVSGSKFRPGACVLVHRLSYPLGRMQIFVLPAIGTAREA
ncbi:hypothetical protein Taro_055900 [Colocasia esculenta]|uniref:Uncharacterized protein n=1 Tax=Colocasia esculenta TaxID=4460 RepID=A0A843XUM7_COLES|nr:hypothetical protein [Colocasia esculenta]